MQINVRVNLIVGKSVPPNHGVISLNAELDTIEWICETNDIEVTIAKDHDSPEVSTAPDTPFFNPLGRAKKGELLQAGTPNPKAREQTYKWTAKAFAAGTPVFKWDPHIIIK